MKKYIFIGSNLITNFKPKLIFDLKDFNLFKKNKLQIFCKNFFVYILLLKLKNNFFKKSNIFIKKKTKKIFTILRAPYRHKLARHQISVNRYQVNISLRIEIKKNINIKNWSNFLSIFLFFKKFNNMFESNLIFLNSFYFSFPISYSKNFKFF